MAAVLEQPEQITTLLDDTRSIAVLGMKPASEAWQPACFVPRYLAEAGFEVIPIPVYYPELASMLGRRAYRSLGQLGRRVDLVDVFRRPEDLCQHLDDLLTARPRAVWLQSGIRHDTFAARLARAGIDVVQNRCLMVEHRRRVPAARVAME